MNSCKRLTSLQATVVLITVQLNCLLIVPIIGLGLKDDMITCSSKNSRTSCTEHSISCRNENRYSDDWKHGCYPSSDPFFYNPINDMYDRCINNDCEVATSDDQSTKYEGAPNVSATFSTVDSYRFDMNVMWTHNPSNSDRVKGYEVRVLSRVTTRYDIILCYCVSGSQLRNLNITGAHELTFRKGGSLRVEVRAYPLPSRSDDVDLITGTYCSLWSDCVQDSIGRCNSACITWPQSCLDLGLKNCHPPAYPPPTNVELHTLVRPFDISETIVEQAMQLNLQWDPPVVEEQYQVPLDKFTYYVQLRYNDSITMIRESIRFKANGNGSLSVSIFPLNLTVDYTVRLRTFYPCAGSAALATSIRDGLECGDFGDPLPIPIPLFPTITPTNLFPTTTSFPSITTTTLFPSTTTTTTTSFPTSIPIATTSTTSTYTPLPDGTDGTPQHPLMEPIVIVTIVCVAVVFLTIVIILLIVLGFVRRRIGRTDKKPPYEEEPEPTSCVVRDRCPIGNIKQQSQVLVMYSPQTHPKQKEYIIQYVVISLRSRCRNISVTYPDGQDFVRADPVQKIEEKVTQSHAVLIVCNEAFQRDWEDSARSSQHVNALRQLFHSNVGRNQLEKFALVILDNNSSYIPSEYLKHLERFNVGKKGTDEERMINFVTNKSPYQLPPVPDLLLSPQSDTTMDYYTARQNSQHPTSHSSFNSSETASLPFSESEDSVILLQESISVESTSLSSNAQEVQADCSSQPHVDSKPTKLNIPICMVSPAVSQSDMIHDSNL